MSLALLILLCLPSMAWAATSSATSSTNAWPAQQEQTPVQSSAPVQAMITKYIPAIGGTIQPVFSAIDSGRVQLGALLNQGIQWSQANAGTKPASEVLDASIKNTSPAGLLGTGIFIAATIGLYAFSVLKWATADANIFYGLLAFAIVYALWRVFAGMRRPSY